MNEQSKPHKMLTLTRALIVLAGLVGLLQLSFWADQQSFEVEGPSRIVKGPQDTLYIQIDRKIAKVSPDGDVLHVLDIDADLAIQEHVADFFVEDDGRLLIARRDSQLLQFYSPEGKLIKTHGRIPSELVAGNHFCKFSKDTATGVVYFADTSHHRIQIYGPEEKEINTIVVPSGVPAAQNTNEGSPQADQRTIASPDTPLHYPNGLLFDRDRIIATDTGNARLIVFYPSGSLDKVIPVMDGGSNKYANPVKVGRYGDAIYAIVRGANFLGGKVAAFDLVSGQPRRFIHEKSIDPWDVFARVDDVLVADRVSLSVLRYSHDGGFLGVYGQPSLQNLYAERQIARKTYQWIRIGSLVCMLFMLGSLLLASRKQRVAHETAGSSLYRQVEILQRFLGPVGGLRRKIILVLIPGMGQAAAGRILRACTVMVVILFFASLVGFSWLQYREATASQPSLHITVVLMFYTVWMVAALDGVRLSGKRSETPLALSVPRFMLAIAAPLITAIAAILAQIIREMIVRGNPDASLAMQMVFRSLMSIIGDPPSSFSAAIPAAVVVGWGGAAAGMFCAIAWQARLGTTKILMGVIAGMFAGVASWSVTVLLVGDRLGWLFYIQPVQGAVLGMFAYLYFRNAGMPLFVIPVAIAGAWTGDLLRLIMDALGASFRSLMSIHVDTFWAGAFARIGLILLPSIFIHLAIWTAWNAASFRPVGSADAVTTEGSRE